MQIIDSTPAALSAALQMYLRNGDVFFDIETTGLSWRTSHLYLIGALFFDPAADTFTLRQWFLDRPTEEKGRKKGRRERREKIKDCLERTVPEKRPCMQKRVRLFYFLVLLSPLKKS